MNGQPPPVQNAEDHFEEDYFTFSQAISFRMTQGFLVADRNDKLLTATLYKPREKVNHVLHLILTLCTCSLWVIVWLIVAAASKKEKRINISVDRQGYLQEQTYSI